MFTLQELIVLFDCLDRVDEKTYYKFNDGVIVTISALKNRVSELAEELDKELDE